MQEINERNNPNFGTKSTSPPRRRDFSEVGPGQAVSSAERSSAAKPVRPHQGAHHLSQLGCAERYSALLGWFAASHAVRAYMSFVRAPPPAGHVPSGLWWARREQQACSGRARPDLYVLVITPYLIASAHGWTAVSDGCQGVAAHVSQASRGLGAV
jgi:hypothetical protein